LVGTGAKMQRHYRNLIVGLLLVSSFTLSAHAQQSAEKGVPANDIFTDKPYIINLKLLSALDPKPLKIESFSVDQYPRAQGVRIISTGRIFPISYEIIDIKDTSNPNALSAVSVAMDGHADILFKEEKSNNELGNYLHYFQRVSLNGKPHHVSSNYIFIKNGTFFHLAANNFAVSAMARSDWGKEKPDTNAEIEVSTLIKSISFK
jgi:hypothetical protein